MSGANADGATHPAGRTLHGRTEQHIHANGHVHCDSNRHAVCYAYVNIYLPGLSPAAVEEPLVIMDIMLVMAHRGETCE